MLSRPAGVWLWGSRGDTDGGRIRPSERTKRSLSCWPLEGTEQRQEEEEKRHTLRIRTTNVLLEDKAATCSVRTLATRGPRAGASRPCLSPEPPPPVFSPTAPLVKGSLTYCMYRCALNLRGVNNARVENVWFK